MWHRENKLRDQRWHLEHHQPTLYLRVIGGLGNQMFQYATARALAARRGAALKLDLTGYDAHPLRRYELASYPIAATIASADELATIGAPPQLSRAQQLLGRILPSARAKPTPAAIAHYREPHFRFDPALANQPLPMLMDGYWQSELYFADAAPLLRRELTPREPLEPLEPENAATAARIAACAAVSLHVRRGDYVTDPRTGAYHGACGVDYYQSALEYMRERVKDLHLFVFSDDRDWTAANLKLDAGATFVTTNPPTRGFRDMQLMSLCRHHIIANSSFSWWGAWLNPSPDKIVVAPARWFASAEHDTSDLLPAEWVRM